MQDIGPTRFSSKHFYLQTMQVYDHQLLVNLSVSNSKEEKTTCIQNVFFIMQNQ